MLIEAPLSVRANAQTRPYYGRQAAAQHLAARAQYDRTDRVDEAKAIAISRPSVADRAIESEPRPRAAPTNGTGRLVDIIA